jgi:ankyrin repeat protein
MIEFLIKEALCRTSCLTDKLATPLQLLSLHQNEDKLVSVLYMLVDRGIDLDAQDIDGNTALHLAALHGSVAAAQFLLSNRADPNIQNKDGDTPLHFAVLGRHEKIVEMLMDNRADPQISSPKNGMPTDFAKKLGLSQVAIIIETMASLQLPQGAVTGVGSPTSQLPSSISSPELGASVPSSSPFSDSILSREGSNENMSSSFVVGSYKADPFVKRMRKMSEAVPMTGRRMPIHDLVIRGQYKRVKQVIEGKKAAIDLRDQNRWTPVLLAAAHGYLNIVELLVEAGADLTCVDQDQSGLLHFVARNRLTLQAAPRISKLISSLVERKFDLNAPNIHGVTALHEACVRGQVSLARALLESGANVEAATKNGESPLIWAAREGRVDIVSFLLGRGASRLTRGRWGTAVDVARGACQFDVVKVLLFFDGTSTSDNGGHRPSLGSSRRGLRAALQAPAEGVVNAASRAVDTMKEIASYPVNLVGTALNMSGITASAEEVTEADGTDAIVEEEEPTQDQVDLAPIFNIMEPLLFQVPCRANFEAGKDKPNNFANVSGWLGIWQSCTAFYASETQKIKMDYVNLKEVKLQKFLFAETRVILQDLDGISKLEVMNKEDILSLSNILQFCFANRHTKGPILLEGQPLVSMVGSIRFPAENSKFHQLFKIDASESLVERTYPLEFGSVVLSAYISLPQTLLALGKRKALLGDSSYLLSGSVSPNANLSLLIFHSLK